MAFSPRIVIFDLDVTLTRYDTFLPFIVGYFKHHVGVRRCLRLCRLPFALLKFWHWGDRTWLKTEMLRGFVGGAKRDELEAWAGRFVDDLLDNGMRSRGLERLREYQRQGLRVILASASFDIYVERVGERLGIDEVLSTRVRWDDRDRLAGMAGENCRDAEKLRRVRSMEGMPGNGEDVIAYSDSHADLPLLSWAEQGIAVCPSKQLRSQAGRLGLKIVDWLRENVD